MGWLFDPRLWPQSERLLEPKSGLVALCRRFLLWSEGKGYAQATVRSREKYLSYFARWCAERAVERAADITRPVLGRYERHLGRYRKLGGEPLSIRSKYARLSAVRALFRYLARENLLLYNPASELDLPRVGHHLPKEILTAAEVERILLVPDLQKATGLRDRALLETLYSTGMRRAEIVGLELRDFDQERETLMIRQAKGRRDRLLPLGSRALSWLQKYLSDGRGPLAPDPEQPALFVSQTGEAMNPDALTRHLRRILDASGVGKRGACHIFRHTAATLMLENGADIRYIQQLLGHAHIVSTQLYTQVSVRKLREVHSRTHPAERGRRGKDGAEG